MRAAIASGSIVSSFAERGWAASVGSWAKSADDRGARAIGAYYGDEFPPPNWCRGSAAPGAAARQKIRQGMTAQWIAEVA
jgi:hypothetical protein